MDRKFEPYEEGHTLMQTNSDTKPHCAWCHKSQDAVAVLIATPTDVIRVPTSATSVLLSATMFWKTIAKRGLRNREAVVHPFSRASDRQSVPNLISCFRSRL
jgi:hypothetical protein